MLKFTYIATGKLPKVKIKPQIQFEKLFISAIKEPIKICFLAGPAEKKFHWMKDQESGGFYKKYCEAVDCELCKQFVISLNKELRPRIEYITLVADLNRTMKIMYFSKALAARMLKNYDIKDDSVVEIEKFKEENNMGLNIVDYSITVTKQHMRPFKGSNELFYSIAKQEGYKIC